MSCWDSPVTGLPLFSLWIVSSFITNLVLQKIVMKRADLLAQNGLPRYLNWIFSVEVCTAVIFLSVTAVVTTTFAMVDLTGFSGTEEGVTNSTDAEEKDNV